MYILIIWTYLQLSLAADLSERFHRPENVKCVNLCKFILIFCTDASLFTAVILGVV